GRGGRLTKVGRSRDYLQRPRSPLLHGEAPMVFPIADDNTDRATTPFVNYVLLAANIFVFVFLQKLGEDDKFTYTYATVPEEILTGKDIVGPVPIRNPITGQEVGHIEHQPLPPFVPVYITLLTSMFMHGGLAHLAGNM